jgi:hypothetical protein
VTFKVDNGVPTTDEDAEMIELSRRGVERLEHHLDAPARQGKHI